MKDCTVTLEDKFGGVGCSRPKGHKGPHIALCCKLEEIEDPEEDIALIWKGKKIIETNSFDWRTEINNDLSKL